MTMLYRIQIIPVRVTAICCGRLIFSMGLLKSLTFACGQYSKKEVNQMAGQLHVGGVEPDALRPAARQASADADWLGMCATGALPRG